MGIPATLKVTGDGDGDGDGNGDGNDGNDSNDEDDDDDEDENENEDGEEKSLSNIDEDPIITALMDESLPVEKTLEAAANMIRKVYSEVPSYDALLDAALRVPLVELNA